MEKTIAPPNFVFKDKWHKIWYRMDSEPLTQDKEKTFERKRYLAEFHYQRSFRVIKHKGYYFLYETK